MHGWKQTTVDLMTKYQLPEKLRPILGIIRRVLDSGNSDRMCGKNTSIILYSEFTLIL